MRFTRFGALLDEPGGLRPDDVKPSRAPNGALGFFRL